MIVKQKMIKNNKRDKGKFNNTKGITLVSLVVTIIILIILAGISLNLTIGQNGLFTMAKKAKENIELAQIEEQTRMNELYYEMEQGGYYENPAVDELEGTIENLNKTIEDLKGQLENEIQQKQELEGIVEELQGRLENAQTEKEKLEGELSNVQSQLENANANKEELERKIQEKDTEIENLNGQLANKTSEKVILLKTNVISSANCTISVKHIEGYENFTIDNFLVVFTGLPESNSNASRTTIGMTKTYNPTTGEITFGRHKAWGIGSGDVLWDIFVRYDVYLWIK